MNSHVSLPPTRGRLLWLLPLTLAGLGSILASSTFDEDENTETDVAVDVGFLLGSLTDNIEWDAGVNLLTISDLRLAGSYAETGGNKLTLDRPIVNIDTTSGFSLSVVDNDPDDDDDVNGELIVSINSTIGLPDEPDEDPSNGQLSVLNATTATTTIVDVNPNGVTVTVGAGTPADFPWDDFADLETDQDANADFRLAYLAFVQLERILALALGAEDLLNEIDVNEVTLESMNLDEALNLSCDSTGGEAVLLWRTDVSGAGEGEISDGDGFEARFENCFDALGERYSEGIITLQNYVAAVGDSPRMLAIDLDYGNLFLGEEPISITTIPSVSSPRINGGLMLEYQESLISEADDSDT